VTYDPNGSCWTSENLPPKLVAILDEQAGRVHSPGGAVRQCLADILNAYDAQRTGQTALAIGDRVQLVGLPQQFAHHNNRFGTVNLLYTDGDCEVRLDGDNYPTICERRNLAPVEDRNRP